VGRRTKQAKRGIVALKEDREKTLAPMKSTRPMTTSKLKKEPLTRPLHRPDHPTARLTVRKCAGVPIALKTPVST
jgi:hypothetical protein